MDVVVWRRANRANLSPTCTSYCHRATQQLRDYISWNERETQNMKTNWKPTFASCSSAKWLWFSLRTACSLAVICCQKINFLTSCVIVLKTVICGQNLWKQDVVNSSSLKKYQRKVKFWGMRCLAGSAGRNYIFSKNVYNKCWNSEIERSVSKKV